MAGLSNLYRAITIVSDPTTIPNVEFVLDLKDRQTDGWNAKRPRRMVVEQTKGGAQYLGCT